jgi:hypothetical protein
MRTEPSARRARIRVRAAATWAIASAAKATALMADLAPEVDANVAVFVTRRASGPATSSK